MNNTLYASILSTLIAVCAGCSDTEASRKQTDQPTRQASDSAASDFEPADFTTAPRRVHASADLDAPPEQVWAYVSNHDNLVAYSGGTLAHAGVDRSGAKEHNGVGTKRSCEMPDGSKFVEDVVYFRAPNKFAYTLADGNSWGLSDHLGVVSVEPRDAGSRLTFELYFNHPQVDTMVTNMTGMIEMRMLPHFAEKFGGAVNHS